MSEFITKVVIKGEDGSGPAIAKATKGIQNYAKAANAAQSQVRTSTRQSRAAFTQFSYQVQDISVQLQAGQSPFIVLAQQGSQVASIFGPGGAVIGALLAVGGAIAGNLLPSLFETSSVMDELKEKAKELGVDLKDIAPYAATRAAYAHNVELKKTNVALVEQVAKVADLNAQFDELVSGRKQPTFSEINELAEDTQEATLKLEQLALKRAELAAPPRAAEAKYETKNAFIVELERREAAQEKINQALEAAKSPLQKLNDLEAEYNRLNQEGYLVGGDYLVLLGDLEAKREELNKKADKSVDILDKEAKAYENLKRSLDPAYGAYQNYYETATLINNSADTQENKITLLAVAYAKLYEALGLVEESQKKVKDSIKAEVWEDAETALDQYRKTAEDTVSMLDNAGVGALRSMEDAMIDLISGTSSVKDAFRDMASSIVKDLIRMQIQRSITGPLSGLLNTALGSLGTAMTYGTNVGSEQTRMLAEQDFAGGGYTGSGARAGGLDGKGGFMAMVHPNETVIDHETGTGGGVTINQTIQVTTGVQQTVRAEIMGMMPQIANASKAAVLDAKKRGGSYASAF